MPGSKPPATTRSSSRTPTCSSCGDRSATPRRWDGPSNPRWARDGRIVVGQRFESWEVLSTAPFQKSGALYVRARCDCGVERDVNLRFMETGRSTMCKGCASRKVHARRGHLLPVDRRARLVQKRVNAMRQRCTNPKDPSWRNYGGRGIEFRFASVRDAVEYVLTHLPADSYAGLDIDRKNNNGHYEPGNLRLATRKQNLANRRCSPPTTSSTQDPGTASS